MIYIVIISVSVIFIAVAYMLTANNAHQILSGYNTLTKEEQKKVDIESYIPFFKRFHINLGLSCLTIGLLLSIFIDEKIAAIFLTIFPIAAYIYFIKKSAFYFKKVQSNSNKLALIVLISVLIFLVVFIAFKGVE